MTRIGTEEREVLEYVPPHFKVIVRWAGDRAAARAALSGLATLTGLCFRIVPQGDGIRTS